MSCSQRLPIRIERETSPEVAEPTVDELNNLVRDIGGADNHFLVVDRVPQLPRRFIQTYRDGDGAFDVEYRDGAEMYETSVADPATVAALILAWAAEEADWKRGADWTQSFQDSDQLVPPVDDEAADYARQTARRFIDHGYSSYNDILQAIMDGAEPDDPIIRPQAEAILEPLWLERVAEQRSWPEVTDADRVNEVFDQLCHNGITAKTNFTCCMSCGTAEIRGEAIEGDRGYVFFHQQDAEHAIDGSLYLAYGAYADGEAASLAVGREVVEAFTAAGMTTRWDGTLAQRIQVVELDWKHRLR
ncbi:MAG TPA: hypothetical protein VE172_22175 [Stackebrandtia sp.]|uniref:DUF6891 domain-containing protein n=1 Tax=Stackebrandtia sp. TaxID=2023065 RepID=UPI002D3FA58A|nr:hypothetical protein [Stackebrandtia sp.]HZE41516.1 hypothetical protein [Stackebrandtia sp.]